MGCRCKQPVELGVKRLDKTIQLPRYEHVGDACMDLRVMIKHGEDARVGGDATGTAHVVLEPGESYVFHTGLIFDIPEGYELKVHPRSGLGIKHHITLSNCTGIIDSCYTDELRIGLFNEGKEPFKIVDGDRVAQGELREVVPTIIKEVEDVPVKSRGTNSGLGSSGVK